MSGADAHIGVEGLTMAYGDFVIQRDLNFSVGKAEVFIIMGGSGCGKSTLLKVMIGLKAPAKGDITYHGQPFWGSPEAEREATMRRFGVLFQSGALFSGLTLAENIGLQLSMFTDLSSNDIAEQASLKLALVGLKGFEDFYPAEISGGMRKRAGLARAMALDPEILFFDEPSAGLDPISSRLLDELIVQLKDSIGATVVMVTHELASIFDIATNSVYLDANTRTMIAYGNPNDLRDHSVQPVVRQFLSRGSEAIEDSAA